MARTLASVATRLGARLVGPDASFGAVSTDTRSLAPGALFVALRGERFDGNDFVIEADAKGAAGALVSRLSHTVMPQIEVADTRQAIGEMAVAWRHNFVLPVIAVTGSAGKTTVKELIASIVGLRHRTCVTRGNLNNEIGVPLTLMRLTRDDELLVVELGANHAGEIAALSRLAAPTVGVITNAGAAHLAGFGSLAGVAAAKGELLDGLPADGTAVLNADDAFVDEWRRRAAPRRIVTFGADAAADCRLLGAPSLDSDGSTFRMRLPDGTELDVELPLAGRQNVVNALAAAAAAFAVGAVAADIRRGLAGGSAPRGRMTVLEARDGATVVDDSYNANPTSVRAALDYLAGCGGRRIFVLGDMGELGDEAPAMHRDIGTYAKMRCDALIGIGPLAREAVEAFGPGALSFDSAAAAATALLALLGPDVTVLVKASRMMRLDRLVETLTAAGEGTVPQC
jgi:UDP-N-acetylmuramoyl-tripeptide--D-alanyl-D-alanine ligase